MCYARHQEIENSSSTGHTQKNGAVLIVNTIKTALFFCGCPVYTGQEDVTDVKWSELMISECEQ
jgi:hypothetical protein